MKHTFSKTAGSGDVVQDHRGCFSLVIWVAITLEIGAISVCCWWFCGEKLWADLGPWWQSDWYSTDPATITQQALFDLWLMLHYHHISLWTMEAKGCSCMNTHKHTRTHRPFPHALLIQVLSKRLEKMCMIQRWTGKVSLYSNWWPWWQNTLRSSSDFTLRQSRTNQMVALALFLCSSSQTAQ